MPAFNSRIGPKEIAGQPAALFYYGIPAIIAMAISAVALLYDIVLVWLVCSPGAAILAGVCGYEVYHHKDALLLPAKRSSKREGRSYLITSMRD